MHTEKRFKKYSVLCSILMVLALLVSLGMPVSAATARATTMKLEKTEGTVTLKTQNGTKRKITNGMRLYNGNCVTTASDSYAEISLDSSKTVKLDQNSSVTFRQNGKKLELLVKTGKLFFNVSSPLTDEESMNIRTSTTVTGIRGTCGVVEYVDVNKSKLYLLEGKVTLGSGDNATTIYGGQTATIVLGEKKEQPGETEKPGEEDQKYQITVEKMTEEAVPVVAITEILNNKELQAKIEKTTDLKIEKLEKVLEESLNPTDPDEGGQEESSEEGDKNNSQEENTDEGDNTQETTPIYPHPPWDSIIEDPPTGGDTTEDPPTNDDGTGGGEKEPPTEEPAPEDPPTDGEIAS
ncbi:MAG: FecR domain-containing protein [Lachnospiraceae bacterium]